MRITLLPTAMAAIVLASCGSADEPVADADPAADMASDPASDSAMLEPRRAAAMLTNADGEEVGTVTATESDGSVMIALEVMNLEPGERGVHVHQEGLCEAPSFQSAGGHWNPADQAHGLEDPAGQHAGDLPNLTIGEDGSGSLEYLLQGGAEFATLMDGDGSAFIIHSGRDDQVTDPSGDSGERMACGVFTLAGAENEPT